ncbi:MAG: PAS domain-containing protein [Planctomycetota bacterium]|jgi:PAS domain S-box-containing protein
MRELEAQIRELSRERDLLKALIDATPTFFVVIDAEGKTRLMNPAMLEALGYREDEVIGTDYLQTFVPVEDRELLSGIFRRITTHQRTLNENRVLTKEGQAILVEWHGIPMFDNAGEFAYLFGIGTDITERRHWQQTIAEKEARCRALLDHAPDPVIVAAAEGEILDANPAAADLLGYEGRELVERMAGEIRLPPTEPWPEGEPAEARTVEASLLHRDGSEVPVTVTLGEFKAAGRRCCLYLLHAEPGEEA